MKVRIRNPIQDTLRRLSAPADQRFRALNPDALKRQVSLVEIVSSAPNLDADPETVRGELRWHCPFHHDTNPSFWAYDHYRETGVGRWGCNPCGVSGDVFDLLIKLHNYSMTEALRWVGLWQATHRGFIRIRLRRQR